MNITTKELFYLDGGPRYLYGVKQYNLKSRICYQIYIN